MDGERPGPYLCSIFSFIRGNVVFFAIETKNVVGVLESITDVFRDAGMSVLDGFHSVHDDGRMWCWVLTVDTSKSKKTVDEVANEIRSLPHVVRVEHGVKKLGELLFPPFKTSFRFMGDRAFVWRGEFMKDFFRSIRKRWGDVGAVFLYHTGLGVGRKAADEYMELLGERDLKKLLEFNGELWVSLGWVSEYEANVSEQIVIRFWDLFECQGLVGLAKAPSGYFTRGVLAGYINKISGKNVVVREVKCIAKGDPCCEFVARFEE